MLSKSNFIEKYSDDLLGKTENVPDEVFIGAALAEQLKGVGNGPTAVVEAEWPTPWKTIGKWEIGGGA